MAIGERIAKAREDRGISQVRLAETLGVTRGTVTRWENDTRTPDDETKGRLAKVLGISIAYLMGEDGEPARVASGGLEEINLNIEAGIRLPILSEEITACCGDGTPLLELTTRSVDYAIFPRKKIGRIDDLRPPFIVNSDGDSMSGFGIQYGALVAINPAEEVRSGNIALVCMGDRVALKKVYIKPSGFELVSSDGRPATIISQEDFDCGWFKILGRGMGAWVDMDQNP